MLTRQQWLWLADHHKEVRSWSELILVFAVIVYMALMFKVSFDKGKAPIPYTPVINNWVKLGCGPAVVIQPGHSTRWRILAANDANHAMQIEWRIAA